MQNICRSERTQESERLEKSQYEAVEHILSKVRALPAQLTAFMTVGCIVPLEVLLVISVCYWCCDGNVLLAVGVHHFPPLLYWYCLLHFE